MPMILQRRARRPASAAMGVRMAIACALALLAGSGSAMAQRVSLADRVSALEQHNAAAGSQAGQLQNENAELRQSNQNRYQDLDGRLQRMEGGAPAAPSASGGAPAPGP